MSTYELEIMQNIKTVIESLGYLFKTFIENP